MIKANEVVTPSPTGPTKIVPCPTFSDISPRFLAHGLFIALVMQNAPLETSVYFSETTWRWSKEAAIFLVTCSDCD
jgi:hypothetical protein